MRGREINGQAAVDGFGLPLADGLAEIADVKDMRIHDLRHTCASLAIAAGHCEVALIPYAANEYTRSCFPLKLYEYLAAGKPAVASGLPELLGMEPDVVCRAEHLPFDDGSFELVVTRVAGAPTVLVCDVSG